MSKKLYEEQNIQDIASHIRNNYVSTKPITRYKVSQMAEAIDDMANDIISHSSGITPGEYTISNGTIENTANMKIDLHKVVGDIAQDTRVGYNLVNFKNIATTTKNGLTISVKNGVITINGTASASTNIYGNGTFDTETSNMSLKSGTYTYVTIISSGSYSNGLLGKYIRVNGTNVYDGGVITTKTKKTITTDYASAVPYIWVQSGTVCNNLVFAPMLLSGDYTTGTLPSFEPYGASPSIDYPSEVKTFTNADIVVCNKNLFNKNNFVKLSGFTNFSYKTFYTNANALSIAFNCKPNTTYTISKVSSQRFSVASFSQEVANNVVATQVIQNLTASSLSIVTGANDKQLAIYYYNTSADTLTEQEILDTIQIEYGSSATTYEAHKEQLLPLDSTNRNLVNPTLVTTTSNGVTCTNNGNGTYTLSGTATADTKFVLYRNDNSSPFEIGKSYYISGCAKNGSNSTYYMRCSDVVAIGNNDFGNGATLIPQNNKIDFHIMIKSGVSCNNLLFKPMLTKGTQELTYVPYEAYSYPLYSTNDYYYKENGKWYVHNEWVKVNASDITKIGVTASQGLYFYQMGINTTRNVVYSNILINKSTTDDSWNALDGKYIGQLFNIGQIYINKKFSTVAEAKQWLVSNNFYMIYKLETPTNTEITSNTLIKQLENINDIRAYTGLTNIIQTSNSIDCKINATVYLDLISAINSTNIEM